MNRVSNRKLRRRKDRNAAASNKKNNLGRELLFLRARTASPVGYPISRSTVIWCVCVCVPVPVPVSLAASGFPDPGIRERNETVPRFLPLFSFLIHQKLRGLVQSKSSRCPPGTLSRTRSLPWSKIGLSPRESREMPLLHVAALVVMWRTREAGGGGSITLAI